MGSRSSTESVVSILTALLRKKTWTQADLAREVGVAPSAIKKRLGELQSSGVPLVSEFDHPHVYWSVPKTWFPGGVLFTGDQVAEMFRLLSRVPKSKGRDHLIEALIKYLPAREATGAVIPAETTEREEQHLPILEDAAHQKVALRFKYFTAGRGKEGTRHASVHRVLIGPPARFVAVCHRNGGLKWFRIENMSEARLDKTEPYRTEDSKKVDAFLRASLDGFHEGSPPAKHVFFVSDPDAGWVARNLLEEMQAEEVPGGIRVTVETSALKRLGRYVVGLGAAAKPLTEELSAEVERIARGALSSITAT